MKDLSHLHALELGLSHERQRLASAKNDNERKLRQVWVKQYEKQIVDERERLGLPPDVPENLSDEELLAALLE
jgi:hypothetical protein